MAAESRVFGVCPDGREVRMYTLENANGMRAEIIDYGAVLVSLKVPDGKGGRKDVVLGYDNLEAYFDNPGFFGATVGPNANRVGGASFVLNGERFLLDKNDGENNLHSHRELGYHKRIWNAQPGEKQIVFMLEDTDGNLGFPGNKGITVTYGLSEDNKLTLHYTGSSDKDTILNLTNHTYFNLKGHDKGTIGDHSLRLLASAYTPVSEGAVPTGDINPVAGTPMDFMESTVIGARIGEAFEQLELTGGYDHNWVIDGWNGEVRLFAEASAPETCIRLRAYTDLPGVQFYAGNFIEEETGKGKAVYGKRSGFCLETQFFPDTANRKEFPSAVFGPEREYDYTTVYEFI